MKDHIKINPLDQKSFSTNSKRESYAIVIVWNLYGNKIEIRPIDAPKQPGILIEQAAHD